MNTEPLSTSADQQAMRFGLFANFENPGGGSCAEALRESMLTVQHAERLGFAEAWITEHHFNPFSVSAAIFPLLSYLAAATTTIRLGSAAVLLPIRDILQVAEDAATVDALSGGRLLLGVARGGPFPLQFQHFGVDQATSRERLLEGALLLEKLLTEENVDFDGRYYRYQQVSIYPRPRQSRIPIWLAALSPESIALAATRGYGLMGASAAPVEKLHTALASYRARAAQTAPPFVLSRYFFAPNIGARRSTPPCPSSAISPATWARQSNAPRKADRRNCRSASKPKRLPRHASWRTPSSATSRNVWIKSGHCTMRWVRIP
ncbi:LLM class flavin-dependent oxidoreductase [Methylomonas sp. CM2]|uniref:LLM class flavin-dependent oxidoreductase n=1 Tax=Methylomonas sp. CM2 TaxID=3417647 RepID=UPI003CF9BA22